MHRRPLLGLTVASLASLAGCLDVSGSADTETPPPIDEPLGEPFCVSVENADDQPYTLRVTVEIDERPFGRGFELDPSEHVEDWCFQRPGRYRIVAETATASGTPGTSARWSPGCPSTSTSAQPGSPESRHLGTCTGTDDAAVARRRKSRSRTDASEIDPSAVTRLGLPTITPTYERPHDDQRLGYPNRVNPTILPPFAARASTTWCRIHD